MAAALTLGAALTPCAAYYHYVQYLNPSSPATPVVEKFDLRALSQKTVTFFVSNSGPTTYATNDSFPSVLSEIRDATQIWNAVATSDLRVAFGGLQVQNTQQNSPGGEIVFEELPPGLLGFTGHAAATTPVTLKDGTTFVPILKSLTHLNIDLTRKPGPSYLEGFFTTVVHEMGHALGLQHTFTSATMSTAVTRATSRARPLDADDIAGISLLYPRGSFPAAFGSISGTVTSGGQGVHLASVVAILPNGSAISSLSNPDGTYEIDGIPPGSYWVYVHPLPPTSNVILPLDSNGNAVPASAPFVSTFFPGTWNPAQFSAVQVTAGATASGIDFNVQPRAAVEAYDVTTYSFPGNDAVQPAYLNANGAASSWVVVAGGTGIINGTNAASGLNVQMLGGWGPQAPVAYQDSGNDTFLAIYPPYTTPIGSGPQHLLFTLADDIYVLPQAIQIAQQQPPRVSGLTQNPDGSVTVAGTGLRADSRVFFDGLPGQITVPYAASTQSSGTANSPAGTVTVMPPPGASGQTATITVYNHDGQNSMFMQLESPFTYAYPQTSAPTASISLSGLPQGAIAMVDITTSNMNFVVGLTSIGFGTTDIAVQHLWVLSPTHAVANVIVSPWALQRSNVATVMSGFKVYEQLTGFQVMPANPNLAIIAVPVPNAVALQNSLYPGAIASVYGLNLAATGATPTLTVAGQSARILFASPNQINFVIPSGAPLGPVPLHLNTGAGYAYPVEMQIDPPPPVITSATSASGSLLSSSQTAQPGDSVTLAVTGIDPAVINNPGRVTVTEGGMNISTFTITAATDGSGTLEIQFDLSASITGQQVPMTVSLDGDLSMPVYINIAAAPTASAQP
jgi:uncharacterized protein (TIGR03437 family)